MAVWRSLQWKPGDLAAVAGRPQMNLEEFAGVAGWVHLGLDGYRNGDLVTAAEELPRLELDDVKVFPDGLERLTCSLPVSGSKTGTPSAEARPRETRGRSARFPRCCGGLAGDTFRLRPARARSVNSGLTVPPLHAHARDSRTNRSQPPPPQYRVAGGSGAVIALVGHHERDETIDGGTPRSCHERFDGALTACRVQLEPRGILARPTVQSEPGSPRLSLVYATHRRPQL
jgi:hypothetical protein